MLGVGRRGKFLVLEPFLCVAVFWSICPRRVRLDIESPPKHTKPRGAVVRFVFDSGTAVLVREHGHERKAGWWVLAAGDEGPLGRSRPANHEEVVRGPTAHEPGDAASAHPAAGPEVRGRHRPGLRRRRPDRAGLSPFSSLSSLNQPERRRLVAEIRYVLTDAIASERRRTEDCRSPSWAPPLRCTTGWASPARSAAKLCSGSPTSRTRSSTASVARPRAAFLADRRLSRR